jgi:hypothetical protein
VVDVSSLVRVSIGPVMFAHHILPRIAKGGIR